MLMWQKPLYYSANPGKRGSESCLLLEVYGVNCRISPRCKTIITLRNRAENPLQYSSIAFVVHQSQACCLGIILITGLLGTSELNDCVGKLPKKGDDSSLQPQFLKFQLLIKK